MLSRLYNKASGGIANIYTPHRYMCTENGIRMVLKSSAAKWPFGVCQKRVKEEVRANELQKKLQLK